MGFENIWNRAAFGRRTDASRAMSAVALHGTVSAELRRLDLYRRGLGAEAIG